MVRLRYRRDTLATPKGTCAYLRSLLLMMLLAPLQADAPVQDKVSLFASWTYTYLDPLILYARAHADVPLSILSPIPLVQRSAPVAERGLPVSHMKGCD